MIAIYLVSALCQVDHVGHTGTTGYTSGHVVTAKCEDGSWLDIPVEEARSMGIPMVYRQSFKVKWSAGRLVLDEDWARPCAKHPQLGYAPAPSNCNYGQ